MSRSEILGSWHNSGFYGHPRSKPRNDFVIEYRHLAKPQPPRIFLKRAQVPSSSHVFSKHDNRHSFLNDALYFEEGLGRKRIANETNRYRPNLLSWMSNGREFDVEANDAPLSCYTVDYRGVSVDPGRLNHRLTSRMRTANSEQDRAPTTVYRYTHSVDNPHLDGVLHPSKDIVTINRTQKPASCFSRESVASCLSWYVAPTPPVTPLPPAPPPPPPPPTHTFRLPAATKADAVNGWRSIAGAGPVFGDSMVAERLPTMTTATMTTATNTSSMATGCLPTKIVVL